MRICVVSDIFGRTYALESLCRTLSPETVVVDPYDGKYRQFHSEAAAYEAFMAEVGLDRYVTMLRAALAEGPKPDLLIGFSVGAAAVWQISERSPAPRAVCFYGSRIRHMTHINPGVPLDCILPLQEPGFSVDDLEKKLSGKPLVTIQRTPYLHGFMNELSQNFDPVAYDRYLNWLCSLIR